MTSLLVTTPGGPGLILGNLLDLQIKNNTKTWDNKYKLHNSIEFNFKKTPLLIL